MTLTNKIKEAMLQWSQIFYSGKMSRSQASISACPALSFSFILSNKILFKDLKTSTFQRMHLFWSQNVWHCQSYHQILHVSAGSSVVRVISPTGDGLGAQLLNIRFRALSRADRHSQCHFSVRVVH